MNAKRVSGALPRTRTLAAFVAALIVTAFSPASRADEATIDNAHVDLAGSQIETMASIPQTQESPSWLDLGVSSWAPRGFTLPSLISATGNYGGTGVPAFYANYSIPLSLLPGLKADFGANYLGLSRSATIQTGSAVNVSESMDLFSARLGAEYTPPSLGGKTLEPYGRLALLPSFAMSQVSTIDSGGLYFGVPLEATLGTRVSLRRIGIPWDGASLDLGIMGTAGTIDHSSVAGYGFNGGLRVML